MYFTEKHTHVHIATQTPGKLSDIIFPVTISSVALNILFIAALVLIIIVFIKARRKPGKVCCTCTLTQRHNPSKIYMFIL